MYKDWRITRWDTPICEVNRLLLASMLRVGRGLVLEFEAFRDPLRPRWKVEFAQCSAFRCIDEAYRIGLWKMLDETGQRCGFTFTAEEPRPFASWGTEYLHEIEKGLQNFVLCTEDDVIEVLSAETPVWVVAKSGVDQAPLPQSCSHFYMGEDEEKIHAIFDRYRSRTEQGGTS